MIPYGKQNINQQDIESVVEVLNSNFLTQGPQVPAFEKAISLHTGAEYTVAVNSATSALHIACQALELGKNDWLWTSPISFVASANCGLYCNANIDFVDIDPKTYNLCPIALKKKLEEAKSKNILPKVVIPVHLCGQSCDMEIIYQLSQEYGFAIIEDASHAIGGKYKGENIGNCRYSDITIFSFHPVKIVTTAEGGAALTNKPLLTERMDILRSHGITRNPDKMLNESHGPWYYEQIDLGQNYRMTELQAALGISQLSRIDSFVAKRNALAKRYQQLLSDLPLVLPYQANDCYSSFHLFVIRLKLNRIRKEKKQIFCELRQANIGVNLHYIPIYKQPYYQNIGFSSDYCSEAEMYYEEAISLPLFTDLTDSDQHYITNTLREIVKE